jgi:hypothetical protein
MNAAELSKILSTAAEMVMGGQPGLSPNDPILTAARSVQGIADSQLEQQARKKAEREEKKRKRKAWMQPIGQAAGFALGGPVGAAIGSGLGSAAATGRVDVMGDVVMPGVTSAVGQGLGKVMAGAEKAAKASETYMKSAEGLSTELSGAAGEKALAQGAKAAGKAATTGTLERFGARLGEKGALAFTGAATGALQQAQAAMQAQGMPVVKGSPLLSSEAHNRIYQDIMQARQMESAEAMRQAQLAHMKTQEEAQRETLALQRSGQEFQQNVVFPEEQAQRVWQRGEAERDRSLREKWRGEDVTFRGEQVQQQKDVATDVSKRAWRGLELQEKAINKRGAGGAAETPEEKRVIQANLKGFQEAYTWATTKAEARVAEYNKQQSAAFTEANPGVTPPMAEKTILDEEPRQWRQAFLGQRLGDLFGAKPWGSKVDQGNGTFRYIVDYSPDPTGKYPFQYVLSPEVYSYEQQKPVTPPAGGGAPPVAPAAPPQAVSDAVLPPTPKTAVTEPLPGALPLPPPANSEYVKMLGQFKRSIR